MITTFLLALQFLTIIPVKIKEVNDRKIADSIIYFPVIGILIGLFLMAVNNILTYLNFPNLVLNVILVITFIFITGGMHLDGLSDTADAFLSGKPKDEMLSIMRDSHAGVMGVLCLISAVLLKTALLYSISSSFRPSALVVMCCLSRWSVVLEMYFFPYARKDGKAALYIRGMNRNTFFIATIIAAACVIFILHLNGLIVLFVTGIFAFIFGKFANRKIGGITGDTLGAVIELAEIVSLFILFFIGRHDLWIS